MPTKVDVLVCGSGSAGLCAGIWLAQYGIKHKVLERRSGPLQVGQADGVQCRTVEVYEAFGIAEPVLKESYHVLEVCFWAPDGKGGIRRSGRTADTPKGLSHMPHVILNQARMNALMLEAARVRGGGEIDYGYEVCGVEVDDEAARDPGAYAVKVVAEKDGRQEEFLAKYVLACDGAHSAVRKSLNIPMLGDSSDAVWGVMDVYPRTTFPDIRKKVILHSSHGSILNIPREGGTLTRFYIELPAGTSAKAVTLSQLQAAACQIFQPYATDVADVLWWSAYAVGQRRAARFHEHGRVFLTGDACHTHSPKAGQGMNVSLQDGFNIGWKLGAILRGQVDPPVLQTYVLEREKVARDLLEFDEKFMELFATQKSESRLAPEQVAERFGQSARFTAGVAARYENSLITAVVGSKQQCARSIVVGMRFPSAQVVRFCDARSMQLLSTVPADGRWRIFVFAGSIPNNTTIARLRKLADFLGGGGGLVHRFNAPGAAIDSLIEPIVVLAGARTSIEQEEIPAYFWPETGKWRTRDLHKIFVDDESYDSGHGHAYEFYSVDPEEGALIVVRPDQYVASVNATDDLGAVEAFFEGFMPSR